MRKVQQGADVQSFVPDFLTLICSCVLFLWQSQSYFAPGKIHYKQQHMGHWRFASVHTAFFFPKDNVDPFVPHVTETGWTMCLFSRGKKKTTKLLCSMSFQS